MRREALAVGAILLALAVALVAAAAWLRAREPLAALPRDEPAEVADVEEGPEVWLGRTLLRVALQGAADPPAPPPARGPPGR
jgi:hypothetical protein